MSQSEARRIAVVCSDLPVSGGLLRFERFGRVAARHGYRLAFVLMRPDVEAWRPTGALLTWDEAKHETWDATMVPGVPFADPFIHYLARFVRPSFGTRVQHVLNDATQKNRFVAVNRAFAPHCVVLNNRHWTSGDVHELQAPQLCILEGAVDSVQFAPAPSPRTAGERLIVGGLANKNPQPLLDAVRAFRGEIELRLIGDASELPDVSDLVEAGRLVLPGVLEDERLPSFYGELDCVVHTELTGGWANLAAEAMASGVPVICTRHGTAAFARDRDTCLLLESATPTSILACLETLRADPDLKRGIAARARTELEGFSWEAYAAELLELVAEPARQPLSAAREQGANSVLGDVRIGLPAAQDVGVQNRLAEPHIEVGETVEVAG